MSQIVNSLYFKWEFKKNNEKHLLRTQPMRDLAEESEGECEEDGGEDWGEGPGAVAVVRLAGVFPVLGASL